MKSFLPITWVRQTILTFTFTTQRQSKVRRRVQFRLYYPQSAYVEYKDDSQIIPRSSSVVVKRLPASRPGKGKASMYIAGAGNAIPVSETVQKGGSINNTWHKGAMSKRFDGKEETFFKPPAPVRHLGLLSSPSYGLI